MESLIALQDELTSIIKETTQLMIVCMGNELRGDDAIGVYIGNRLLEELPHLKERILITHTVPVNFLSKIVNYDPSVLIFVDAIDLEVDPGTIALFDHHSIINTQSTSTHYQEMEDLILFLQKEMKQLPDIKIIGVQVKETPYTVGINKVLTESSEKLIDILTKLLR
ncbi:MAG: hydrogenase maturation protease [Candidatus Kariarchaeaceae archaeon]|jgi:hydrogenase 3 maturation protease